MFLGRPSEQTPRSIIVEYNERFDYLMTSRSNIQRIGARVYFSVGFTAVQLVDMTVNGIITLRINSTDNVCKVSFEARL